jgi:hypothetical protein
VHLLLDGKGSTINPKSPKMSTIDEGSRFNYQRAPLFQMISAPVLRGNGIEVVKKFILARNK